MKLARETRVRCAFRLYGKNAEAKTQKKYFRLNNCSFIAPHGIIPTKKVTCHRLYNNCLHFQDFFMIFQDEEANFANFIIKYNKTKKCDRALVGKNRSKYQ